MHLLHNLRFTSNLFPIPLSLRFKSFVSVSAFPKLTTSIFHYFKNQLSLFIIVNVELIWNGVQHGFTATPNDILKLFYYPLHILREYIITNNDVVTSTCIFNFQSANAQSQIKPIKMCIFISISFVITNKMYISILKILCWWILLFIVLFSARFEFEKE